MKKKYVIIILLLLFVLAVAFTVFWVRSDTWERRLLDAEDEITDSADADVLVTGKYQKVNGVLYYVKDSRNVLLARQEGKETEVCQNVDSFFIWKERLFVCDSKESILYWMEEDGYKHLVMPEVHCAGVINNRLYVAKWEELYYYDCDEQTGTKIADFTEKDGGIHISDIVFVNGYVVRLIPDKGIWAFSLKDRHIYEYDFPFDIEEGGFYTTLGGHGGAIFLSVYRTDSEEMGTSLLTRKTSEMNGIYKYNLKTGAASKVSEQSGDDLFSIGKDLYVVDKGIFTQRIKKVDLANPESKS